MSVLALAYSKHLGPTRWTYALGCRLTIFHGYALGVLHLFLGAAFHTVSLHLVVSFLYGE